MLVRIARFNTPPTDDRDWVIDALRPVPGVRAAYHAVDRETRAMLSISIYDDDAASEAALAAIRRAAEDRAHHGVPPDEIRLCEVVRFLDRTVDYAAQERQG
jgi:aspartate/tyrosine/aromatic aminotransferase